MGRRSGAGDAGFACGGATTAGFSAAGGAGGAATVCGARGFTGGAAGALLTGGAVRAGGAGGCCCSCSRCFSSFNTSPGLEILERSIFGLISDCADFSLEEPPDRAVKCLRIFSASSSSTELECVFFSVIPTSCNTSSIALLFTSSSLARSLIRIFIRSVFPPGYCPLRDHIDLTALALCNYCL